MAWAARGPSSKRSEIVALRNGAEPSIGAYPAARSNGTRTNASDTLGMTASLHAPSISTPSVAFRIDSPAAVRLAASALSEKMGS